MTTPSICPKCGATIPDGAPQGLCPKCVLLGAATEIQSVARPSKAAAPPTVAELAVHFPDLEVLELIGAGGMGAVYKARQPKLDRFVALKILSGDLAGDPAFAERFDREARVLARLNHPNIVTVFDSGMAGPFAYLLMEFVDGVNLRQAMKTGRFTPAEALSLVQDVCSALKFAHEQGILHRDIKPENILIDSRGQVKIADFGIAKLTGEEGQDLLTLTHRGFVLGSPHYMAPEQFESPGDVDQRADIYSLGVVLYELLTGDLPLGRFAPPSKKSAVDARIDEIVMRTLERERELRFQTVGEVKTQMEAAKDAKPTTLQSAAGQQRPNSLGVTARHATASAFCTGISLLLVPSLSQRSVPASQPVLLESASAGPQMLTLLVVALAVLTPLIGTGLGICALRDIRESSGRRLGFFRSMFGALAWPVLLILGAAGVLTASAFEMAGSRNDLLFLVLTILLGVPAVALLVSRVARWVKGVTGPKEIALEATDPPAGSAKPWIIWSTLSPAVGVMALVGLVKLYGGSVSSHSHMRELHVFSPVTILVLLLVASAVVGAVQALRAVRRIRSSGGALAGADRSGMTLLIWPSILAAGMSVFGVVTLFHESAVSMVWRLLLCGLLLIVSSMGMGIVGRTILSMRKGFPSGDSRGPVIRFAVAAIIALVCIGAYSWQRESTLESYLEPGGTKSAFKVSLVAGRSLSFRLIRVNAAGAVVELEPSGTLQAPVGGGYTTTLEIVTTNRWKESSLQQIAASYHGPSGQPYSRSVYLDDIWEFNTSGTGASPLMEGEKQRYEIARRRDWMGRKLETLYLEITPANHQP